MEALRKIGVGSTCRGSSGAIRIGLALAFCVAALLAIEGCRKTPKAMDALWSADLLDDNGFARNPVWSQMKVSGQPPDPCTFCPCENEAPSAWENAANCTNQSLHTNSSFECFGHWNWFPVAYEGTVTWGGHSNSWYDDDDYYFDVARSDLSLATASDGKGIHIEFDSEQTVDYWDDTGTWWDDFHHNYVDDSDQAAHGRIDNQDVLVIGMLGLDKQHGVHSELQPVYAMFVHVQDDPAQDKWAFFFKNWGNEGYCGDNDEPLDWPTQNVYRVRLRHPVGGGFGLTQNVWVYGDDEDERDRQSWTFQTVGDGLLLTFRMRDPSKQCGFVGDLTINWGAASSATGPRRGGAAPAARAASHYGEDGDMALKAKLDRLDSADRKLLAEEVKNLKRHARPNRLQGTMATESFAPPAKPARPYPNYGRMAVSAPNPARKAERLKRREVVLAFLKAHGIE